MAEIDILMATYNGEKYIAEQIDSILAQTFQDFRLVIRDDGSQDKTPEIIADYEAKYPGKIEVVRDDVVCRHPTKNFFELLKHAQADYVMFSDQDDYWLPEKVQITLEHMKKAEQENPNNPVLVFTGKEVVDKYLKRIDKQEPVILAEHYTFTEILYTNCAYGCTQMINKSCYEGMGGFDEAMNFHDLWASLYASLLGVIVYVPDKLILYRQHENNVVGADKGPGKWGTFGRIGRFLQQPVQRFVNILGIVHNLRRRIFLLQDRFKDRLSPEQKSMLEEYSRLFSSNVFKRFAAMKELRRSNHFSKRRNFSVCFFIALLGNK